MKQQVKTNLRKLFLFVPLSLIYILLNSCADEGTPSPEFATAPPQENGFFYNEVDNQSSRLFLTEQAWVINRFPDNPNAIVLDLVFVSNQRSYNGVFFQGSGPQLEITLGDADQDIGGTYTVAPERNFEDGEIDDFLEVEISQIGEGDELILESGTLTVTDLGGGNYQFDYRLAGTHRDYQPDNNTRLDRPFEVFGNYEGRVNFEN